ncbi:hypothetical protein HPB50_009693 [Hyalomma asiaticum]|uniref:Uncharacterized protein n=1 Tax=Hyalomma asiaticum TaxID=266040 RepID=A0ACB7TFB7_HYAAI|nr:hypothetical protein HPB50_009693 [Hyalomma asiaticum]
MENEYDYDLSIPFGARPRPTPLLTTVDKLPSLTSSPLAVPITRYPEPAFTSYGYPRSGASGCHQDSGDSSGGSGAAFSPVLQGQPDAATDAAECSAASADNTLPMTQESGREHQPLLTLEAEATLAQEGAPGNTLRYFLIGILLAGLVIAAVLATVNAPGGPLAPHDLVPEERRPAHHRPRPSYKVPRDQHDKVLVLAPSVAQQAQPLGHASNTNKYHNRLDNSARMTSADRKSAQNLGQRKSPGQDRYVRANMRVVLFDGRLVGDECRRFYYTYCSHPVALYHYDPELRACVPTSDGGVQLCNHGSNRFSSWERCRESCMKPDRVSNRCLDNTLFMPCTSQDIVSPFWYFDGSSCTTWEFPRGNCPQSHQGVFKTHRECSRVCEGKRGVAKGDLKHCRVPELSACSLKHLKYPYFANMQAEGSARCVNASRTSLLARRCLVSPLLYRAGFGWVYINMCRARTEIDGKCGALSWLSEPNKFYVIVAPSRNTAEKGSREQETRNRDITYVKNE